MSEQRFHAPSEFITPSTSSSQSSSPLAMTQVLIGTGNTIADAAPILANLVEIGESKDGSGVQLPPSSAGIQITISVFSEETVKLYPQGDESINGNINGNPVNLASPAFTLVTCKQKGNWSVAQIGNISAP